MATLLSPTTTNAAPMQERAVNITLPPLTRPAINVTVPVNVTVPSSFVTKNETIPMNITVSGQNNGQRRLDMVLAGAQEPQKPTRPVALRIGQESIERSWITGCDVRLEIFLKQSSHCIWRASWVCVIKGHIWNRDGLHGRGQRCAGLNALFTNAHDTIYHRSLTPNHSLAKCESSEIFRCLSSYKYCG